MRERLLIGLCWLVILGNLLMAANAPTLMIRSKGELLAAAAQMCAINILSICCAFILRARIIRESRAGGTAALSSSAGGKIETAR